MKVIQTLSLLMLQGFLLRGPDLLGGGGGEAECGLLQRGAEPAAGPGLRPRPAPLLPSAEAGLLLLLLLAVILIVEYIAGVTAWGSRPEIYFTCISIHKL